MDIKSAVTQTFVEDSNKNGICIDFIFQARPATTLSSGSKFVPLRHTAKIIVVFFSERQLKDVTSRFVEHLHLNAKILIFSVDPHMQDNADVLRRAELNRTFVFLTANAYIPGFKEFVYEANPTVYKDNDLLKKIWDYYFECPPPGYNKSTEYPWVRHFSLRTVKTPNFDLDNFQSTCNIYIAVYAIAHALHNMYISESKARRNGGLRMEQYRSRQMNNYLRNLHFKTPAGNAFSFHESENANVHLVLVQNVIFPNQTIKKNHVGEYIMLKNSKPELFIKEADIIWQSEDKEGTMNKKVAIIGAGCSGLAAIKCCLDEGLEPTCFERSSDIGGLWRYTEDVEEGRASLYNSVVTNTSKEMMCYSDFPMPPDFPVFLHHEKMLEYLNLYVEHFNLRKYIQFNTEVQHVKEHPNFSNTGQWNVGTEQRGIKETAVFDAVIVCNGHYSDPYFPLHSFPGIEDFKGHYIHSRFYKTPDPYRGKTVLIVGTGNSAGDIAVEIGLTAKQVFLSSRNGSWVVSRIVPGGFPVDMALGRRCTIWIKNILPFAIASKLNEKLLSHWFDHANYGLEPTYRLKHPIVNDYLPSQILQGSIKIKPRIKQFTETSAIFEDGTEIANLDLIIFATGYKASFPFLDGSIIKQNDNHLSLYKHVFPIHLEKQTLAVLGLIQPLGPIFPTSELQARWVTRVLKGAAQLPSVRKMEAHTTKIKKQREKWFGSGRTQNLQTHYIDYINEISVEIKNHPNVLRLILTDPTLAWKVFFGPCTPYQMRLTGPGKWHGARGAIFTQWERTFNPTRTRTERKNHYSGSILPTMLSVCAIMAAIYLGYQYGCFESL
uniref:Flavin-containing monooxygenase n=1 Tax=Leptobrachium leishanense TaxID=445787 RepID=A0A8C5PLV2_9ANUR